jgi:hypothetical protein
MPTPASDNQIVAKSSQKVETEMIESNDRAINYYHTNIDYSIPVLVSEKLVPRTTVCHRNPLPNNLFSLFFLILLRPWRRMEMPGTRLISLIL